MSHRTTIITILLALMTQHQMLVSAQKIVTVEGEYKYCASPNMSPVEAKAEAIKHARLEALANSFGRLVTSNSFLGMELVDNKEHTSFVQIGESEVKGEWLSDIDPPKVVEFLPQEDLSIWITVRVKGKAREIVSAPVQFETKILKNGTEDHNESDDFKEGDRVYMSFRSPVKGYLAIYMIDDEGMAYRLLPYNGSNKPAFEVDHDKKYVLFSNNNGTKEVKVVCKYPIEFNHIYTLFSPNKFTRPLDNGTTIMDDGKTVLPPSLPLEAFQKWFLNVRKHDKDMSVSRKTIRTQKKNR